MSQDVFAHAAYGVALEEDEASELAAAIAESSPVAEARRDDWEDMSEADQINESVAVVSARSDLIDRLRRKYHAPPDARIIWTGSEDERTGRCNIEANAFVLGYGLYQFPGVTPPKEFQDVADWHTWVEGE